jgi:hypothetical protein
MKEKPWIPTRPQKPPIKRGFLHSILTRNPDAVVSA